MFIIEGKQDINVLKASGVICKEYMKEIESQFMFLFEQVKDEEEINIEEVSMELCGYLVLLERADNIRNLSVIGLDTRGGLLASIPERIKEIKLNRLTVYQALIVYNNSFAVTFYIPDYIIDEELQEWINENMNCQ